MTTKTDYVSKIVYCNCMIPPLSTAWCHIKFTNHMSITSVKIPAARTARSAIIFVHGLGDSGDGWSWFPQVVAQTGLLRSLPETNFVFPNAPSIPVSANGGMRMPAWFDIYEFGNPNAPKDVEGFMKSCNVLKELVLEQIKQNIPAERIIIGGFSQGAAVAMALLALLDIKIGGVVGLSGFCPADKAVREKVKSANFTTPAFQGHGDVDPVVPFAWGQETAELYKSLGFSDWSFHKYSGVPHSTSEEELIDVVKFLAKVLD